MNRIQIPVYPLVFRVSAAHKTRLAVGAKKSATAAPRNNNNNDNVDRDDVFLCVYNVRQKVVFYDDFVFKNPPKE